MISANGGLPAPRYTPQVTQRWPRGSEPASKVVFLFVALREIAVHILEQVRLLRVECGPFDCLPVLDMGAVVCNRVGGGLRRSTWRFGQHREVNG